jgi:murein L,D-transpeptidase YcbB/YkuD
LFTSRNSATGCLLPGGWFAGGAIAVAAACALAAPVAFAAMPEPRTATLVPAALSSEEPTPAGPALAPTPRSTTELGSRIENAPGLAIAGEKLKLGLLRRFYAAHGFEPVWTTRQAQADSLLNAVLRAGDHGLDPNAFHAGVLRNPAFLSPLDRELLLSDAFLSYADALARGAFPIERRMDDLDLTPEPIDIAATLTNALASPDPGAAVEALAPTTQTYQVLRQALRAHRTDGAALSGDKSAANRLRQIEVNLERQRWLPRQMPAERVWVNTADAKLTYFRGDMPIFTTRVIVGATDKQSPELRAAIDGVLFNPPWNVPYSIVSKEIMPKLSSDPNYLTKQRMTMKPNGGLQQAPPSALGQLKFEMPNRHDVYLHDTPTRNLFARDNRRLSHGCIRVQNPRELAALLMEQPAEVLNRAIAGGTTNRRSLSRQVSVFVVYQTAFLDTDGSLQFRPDVYNRDDEIWPHLHPVRQAPVAEREPASQRRG